MTWSNKTKTPQHISKYKRAHKAEKIPRKMKIDHEKKAKYWKSE